MMNDQIYNLSNLLRTFSTDELDKICQPLLLLKIHHFHFMRIFNDGSCISIAKNKTWLEHFYKESLFSHAYFTKNSHFKNGSILWNDIRESLIILERRELFNVTNNGLTITIPNTQFCNFYHFSCDNFRDIKTLHSQKLELLYRFIHFFHSSCYNLIKEAQKHKLFINWNKNSPQYDIASEDLEIFLKQTQYKRFYLEQHDCYLTRKEMFILKQYLAGNSCLEIAKSNHLSTATVQTHINNVKNKLSCRKTTELISILQDVNFFDINLDF